MNGNYELTRQSQYDDFINHLKKSIGKLLLCQVYKDSPIRYFIYIPDRISGYDRNNFKIEWWNSVVCLSRSHNTGFYICRIDDFMFDDEYRPTLKVTPVFDMEDEMVYDKHLLNVFFMSHLFAYDQFESYHVQTNIWEVEKHVRDRLPNRYIYTRDVEVSKIAVNDMIDHKLKYDVLHAWLHCPSAEAINMEQRSRDIRVFFVLRADNSMVFPLIFERYDRVGGDPENFIEDLCSKYEVAVQRELIPPTKGLFHQIESYLKFDNDRKAANKAKKTAAKKAKKKGNKNEL